MKKRMEFLYRGVALLLAALLMLSDLTVIASAVVEDMESQQIEQVEQVEQIEQVEQQVEETEQVEVTVCDVCGMEECVCEAEDEPVEEPQEDVLDEEVQEESALLPQLMMAVPFADNTVSIEWNGSRIVAKSSAETASSYVWMRADAANGVFTEITGQTKNYYDITTADEDKYIKAVVDGVETEVVGPIGKLVEFYIDKGSVTLGVTYSGRDSDGNAVSGTHTASNIYVVKQSNNSTFTKNKIEFSGHHPYAPFDVTLDGVNMYENPTNHSQAPGVSGVSTPSGGNISITATASAEKHVTLRLKGENQVRNITYYNGGDTQVPATVKSELKITDINGDGATDGGSLYMPRKLKNDETIDSFVATKTNYNHWNAVIGGLDATSLVQNLHIAGGTLQVLSTLGDNCTAIGAGGNGYCQMKITGGDITAHCNGTGTAIGGGIGWNAAGGPADIEITGGTIYAKNHGNITSGTDLVGGVAIGAGSSFHKAGSYSTVTIKGGTVEAHGTFGNGLGGGNSSTSTGGSATIAISDATVTASSIGGGNSKSGDGGQATVTIDELIDDSTTVTLTKGIGGGDSASGNGGKATITVNGGTMTANGTIGGGDGGGTTGVGGEAEVTVKGGTLKAAAIGGGTGSGSGAGGKATVTVEEGNGTLEAATIGGGAGGGDTGVGGEAEVIVKGGTLKAVAIGGGTGSGSGAGGKATVTVEKGNGTLEAATIGGGTGGDAGNGGAAVITIRGGTVKAGSIGGGRPGSDTGSLGYATADITGGDISGQFLLQAAGDASCYFRMSGGTLHGVDTAKTEPYDYAQNDGAAVYMDDPKGEVTISGGTIKDCSAAKGGAIYMSAGTCTIKENATISNCNATESGGAIYLAGGEVIMEGGTLGGETVEEANTATIDGGAIYLEEGTVSISGGTVSKNSASQNGGAIYLADGEVTVSGGTIKNNSAANDGGAVYVGSGSFTMSNGMLIGNSATANGGAAYVAGNFTMTNGTIGSTEDGTANTAGQDGGAVYVNNGNFTMSAGTVSGNTAEQNGGGIAVNNGKIIMSGGAVSGNKAKGGDGGGMYVSSVGDSEVAVKIYSGEVRNNTAAISGGAVAVEGSENSEITVHVGVNEQHYKNGNLELGFEHTEEDGTYTHSACPVIGGNISQKNGGAFYITGGTETHLDMYCLTDSGGNETHGDDDVLDQSMSDFLMVEGGKVYITTSEELVGEDEITPPGDDRHGSTIIKGSIHIVSGVLELFGSKTNPKLDGSLTIDLMTKDDRYFDHREADGIVTISYHENFTLDGANAVTQTAFDVKDGDEHSIHPSMYAHEGYTFLGWNSNENAKKGDNSGHWFDAGTFYTFHLTDEEHKIEGTVDGTNVYGDIVIYAIWEPNGYYVEYLPGVPDGEEWYGEIKDNGTRYTYATEYKYAENGFVYPGYKFDGWSVPNKGKKQPGETFLNLTSTQGATVPVTAQWVECKHPDEKITYTVEGSTITKTCDQCKLTATATLSAEDATYDGNRHEAWLTLSNKTFWNPGKIQYEGVTLNPVDTLADLPDGGQLIEGDKLCVNAGNYTATITAPDGPSVSVNYKIDKAKQSDPNGRPSYTPPESGNTLLVTKLPIGYRQSPETGVYAKHVVRYYNEGNVINKVLEDPTPKEENQLKFDLPAALKTYSVMAYYPETENYYASEWVSAETTFTFGENLQLTFVPDAGINIFSAPEKAENEVALQLETRNGYYLVGEKYTFSPEVINGEMSYDTNNLTFSESEGIHYVSVDSDKLPEQLTKITVYIGTTKRTPGMSVEVKEKEVFRNFTNNNPVTIAQDSAFTAKCTVTGYDVSVYEEMTLKVPMPEGTSIILRDLGDGSYWYYTAESNLTSVPLGAFMRMGKPEEEYNRSGDLMLLFVVDYADATTKPNIGEITLSLSAGTKTDAVGIMAMPTAGEEVTLAEVSLALSSATEPTTGLTQTVTVKADNTVAASRYDHRDVALVLSPSSAATTVVEVPIDASVQATIKGKNATWRPNENGNIVIPLGDFTALSSSESVTLELSSDMFPVGVKQYTLSAQLYLSPTDADTSPMNGVPMGSAVNLTFTSQRDETGIKICVANDQRLFAIGSSITAQVEYSSELKTENIDVGYNVNVELHWEIDNGFANTAIAPTRAETNNTYVFDLSKAQRGGNYCIVATLVADNGYVLNEARYYFILQEASEEDPTQGPSQGTNQEGSDPTKTEQGTTENP